MHVTVPVKAIAMTTSAAASSARASGMEGARVGCGRGGARVALLGAALCCWAFAPPWRDSLGVALQGVPWQLRSGDVLFREKI